MRVQLAVLGVLAILPTGVTAVGVPGEAVELGRSARGLPIVAVSIDGVLLRLGLDTGTSRTLLSGKAAARLGLIPRHRLAVGDAAGTNRRGLCAQAPTVRLGALTLVPECLGWLPDEPDLAGAEDLDGVLGADLVAQMDVYLDLRSEKVRAHIAPPGSLAPWVDGRRLAVQSIGRRPALAVTFDGGKDLPPAQLIIDSGSDGLVLFGEMARQTAAIIRGRLLPARIETATTSREVALIPLQGVRSGGARFGVPWAGLLPEVLDRTEDGLLPLTVLGPALLDLSNGVVVAKARLRPSPHQLAVR